MPKPDETSHGVLKSLDHQLDAFEASRASKPSKPALMGMGDSASDGFRLLGQLIGGVLGGLGLGWLVDRFAGTSPLGMVCGLLIGTGLSIYAAVRSAMATSAKSAAAGPPAAAVVENDDDEGA